MNFYMDQSTCVQQSMWSIRLVLSHLCLSQSNSATIQRSPPVVYPLPPPAYLGRLERLPPGRQHWAGLLNTAYPNQSLNCFQVSQANVPSLTTSNDYIFERGAPGLVNTHGVNNQPTDNHGSAGRQYMLS